MAEGSDACRYQKRYVSISPSKCSLFIYIKCWPDSIVCINSFNQVWPIEGIKKFETLSYLPPLTVEDLLKQIEYLLRSKWVPCLEFSKVGFVYRENHRSPGYYDGRYWTMWKLPMFGCTDATQVLKELEEAKKAYPDAFVRIIGFDNVRQVQLISFIAYKPPGCEESGGN